VQQTILDECWKPAFARYLIPKQTGLRLDLERYPRYYNTERAHTGRWTWTDPRPDPREGQTVAQEALMRRHNSGTGHVVDSGQALLVVGCLTGSALAARAAR
jgi:hypothetical protein